MSIEKLYIESGFKEELYNKIEGAIIFIDNNKEMDKKDDNVALTRYVLSVALLSILDSTES